MKLGFSLHWFRQWVKRRKMLKKKNEEIINEIVREEMEGCLKESLETTAQEEKSK